MIFHYSSRVTRRKWLPVLEYYFTQNCVSSIKKCSQQILLLRVHNRVLNTELASQSDSKVPSVESNLFLDVLYHWYFYVYLYSQTRGAIRAFNRSNQTNISCLSDRLPDFFLSVPCVVISMSMTTSLDIPVILQTVIYLYGISLANFCQHTTFSNNFVIVLDNLK